MAKKPIPKKNAPSRVKGNAQPTSLPALAKAPEMPYAELEHVQGGNLLDPLDGKNGIKAKVFPPTGSTGRTFHWKLKDYPHPEFSPLDVPSDKDEITVPPDWISRCIALTVLYWYEAFVNGVHHKSLVGELFVQSLREDQTEDSLPELPQVVEESNTRWLKMQSFDGDAIVQFEAPPMPVEGMRLYVVAVGDEHHANPAFIWLEFGRPITVEEAHPNHVFEYKLWRWWLARREDWSSITISLAWLYHGNLGEFDTSDPFNHRYLPKNGEDFHSRYTTLLRVDPRLDLLPPHLVESTLCGDGEYVLNPINSKDGGNVKATYEGMTKGDVVCAYAYGEGFPSVPLGCITLQGAETETLFNLPAWLIAAFFERTLKLTFSVQFGSNPAQTSPEREVKVLAPKLTTPFIEQATRGTLALRAFSGDATACVPIWDYAALGQCVWVWITGTLEDGSPYLFYILMDEPLTTGWLSNGVDAPIPRAALQKLEDCSDFELHTAVSFNGKCDLATAIAFPARTFKIEQEPLVLLEAKVTEAVGTNLTAYNGRNGVHVEVNYVGNNPKRTLSVCWKKPDGTCWPLASKPGSSSGPVIFPLPPEAVIESMGKVVEIIYTVTSACKVQASPPLNLNISLPVRLETPNLLEATPPRTRNAVLDLRTFIGNANSLEDPMWFLRAGQKCWLRVDGTGKDGNPYSFYVYSARTITAAEETAGVADPVLRSELDKLKDKTNFSLSFSVATDGSSTANVVCPLRVLELRKIMRDFTTFTGGARNDWKDGPAANGETQSGVQIGKSCLFNMTSSPIVPVGVLLYKDFSDLVVGRTYKFSILAAKLNYAPWDVSPLLTLSVDGVLITAIINFPNTGVWVPITGTFIATATSARLAINNHESEGLLGNDPAITDVLVEG